MADEKNNDTKGVIDKKFGINEWFEKYLALGTDRSLAKLKEKWDQDKTIVVPALSTFKRWSKDGNWVEESDHYDKIEHKAMMKAVLKKAVKSKVEMVRICRGVLVKFGEQLKDPLYRVNMRDTKEAYAILKLELGEGMPEWGDDMKIDLIAVFEEIIDRGNARRAKEKKDAQRRLDD